MSHDIATATWTPRPGDPSADEAGRWCVEMPEVGHIAIIERGPWEYQAVAADLRQLLEIDGVRVGEVEIGIDVVTACAPTTEAITATGAHPQQPLIDGLRQLADILAAHPELAVARYPVLGICSPRRAIGAEDDDGESVTAVEEYSSALGIPVKSSVARDGRTHHVIDGCVAGLGLKIFHISDTRRCCGHICTHGGEM